MILSAGAGVTFPTDQNVSAYEVAFFPCENPEKGQPLWVINTTQYNPSELIPDHTTNLSGLIVFARPEYNNTTYRCRFIQLSVSDFGFLDEDITTSPQAVLTVTALENGKCKYRF